MSDDIRDSIPATRLGFQYAEGDKEMTNYLDYSW